MNKDSEPKTVDGWPLLLFGLVCVGIVIWLNLSGMDYRGGSVVGSYRSGGWFFLSLPIIFVLWIPVAIGIAFLSPKLGRLGAWLTCISLATLGIAYSGYQTLPTQRASRIFNCYPIASSNLVELKQRDSFNDGVNTTGILELTDEAWTKIVSLNELQTSTSSLSSFPALREKLSRDDGLMHSNSKLRCFRTGQLVYFRHRSRIHQE